MLNQAGDQFQSDESNIPLAFSLSRALKKQLQTLSPIYEARHSADIGHPEDSEEMDEEGGFVSFDIERMPKAEFHLGDIDSIQLEQLYSDDKAMIAFVKTYTDDSPFVAEADPIKNVYSNNSYGVVIMAEYPPFLIHHEKLDEFLKVSSLKAKNAGSVDRLPGFGDGAGEYLASIDSKDEVVRLDDRACADLVAALNNPDLGEYIE